MDIHSLPTEQTTAKAKHYEEIQIRHLMADYIHACRDGDLKKIKSLYTNDVVSFDMPPPHKMVGLGEYMKSWEKWYGGQFDFPVIYDSLDLQVHVSGDVGFTFDIIHSAGTFKKTGERIENWLRHTCGLVKVRDRWLIAHEHISAPVGEDGKALSTLNPDQIELPHH